MQRAVEALDDQKDWHGQENLLPSSRLGLRARFGCGHEGGHVCMLVGCLKFNFKKKHKLVQRNPK